MANVIMLKLVSGETIVGLLNLPMDTSPFEMSTYFTQNGVPILYPKLVVAVQQQNGTVRAGFNAWCPFMESFSFTIALSHIIHMDTAVPEVVKQYDDLVGSTLRLRSLSEKEMQLSRAYSANTDSVN